MTNSFFVVWQPEHGSPTFRHENFDLAIKEAERLSNQNPGMEFHVLRSMGHYRKPKLPSAEWNKHEVPLDDVIPF